MKLGSIALPFVFVALALACAPPEPPAAPAAPTANSLAPTGSWPAFGGPHGDFKVEVAGLAASWPAQGPPKLWSRSLGEGYSAIVADGGTLYTMYRVGDDELAIALDAADGTTRWEHRYPAPIDTEASRQFGKGPHATPLLIGDRLITLGYTGLLHALDRKTGNVLWSHDLRADLGGAALDFGYSASPIAHDGHVIVLVGGESGVVALSPADGSVAWKGPASSVSYATPVVIDVGGQLQLVYFSADEIIGLDAGNGTKLWSFPVVNQYRNNATPPQWGDDGLLWVATQLDGGTRALRLTREGQATEVEEVWSSNQLSIHFWNTLRLGEQVYASIGSNASILAGVDVGTGAILWRERGFEQVNFVHAGEATVMLDANGQLALARLSPGGIEVLARTELVEGPTWTAPTLVGSRLYLRNKESILAVELG